MDNNDLIICQGFFDKDIVEILRKEVEKSMDKIDIFNQFFTSKKYLKDG